MEHDAPQDPSAESSAAKENQDSQQGPSLVQPETENTEKPSDSDLQKKYDELNEQQLRLAADFENFRKRVAQEREALLKYGAENTIQSLLPIMDNLERASNSLNEDSDPKMLYQSFNLLSKQLLDSLANQGLKKVKTVGQAFDPKFHEATLQVETSDHPENNIVQELQSGFMLHDRVIRPALVSVATPPADSERETTSNKDAETAEVDNEDGNPFAQPQETESNS